MICRIYGFANERAEYMEKLSIANFDPKEPYIYPIGSHYTLRRELAVSMNARQFFQAAQSEPLEELPDLPSGILAQKSLPAEIVFSSRWHQWTMELPMALGSTAANRRNFSQRSTSLVVYFPSTPLARRSRHL